MTLEAPHRHQRQGKLFEATVRITTPGREIVADNPHPRDHAHEDPYVAVRDAFRAAERQLQDHAQVREKIAPLLSDEATKRWLETATAPVSR